MYVYKHITRIDAHKDFSKARLCMYMVNITRIRSIRSYDVEQITFFLPPSMSIKVKKVCKSV